MEKVNEIEFRKSKSHNTKSDVIHIYIDNRNLIEILKEYEIKFDKKIAGAYEGMDSVTLFENLTGKGFSNSADESRFDILDCECEEYGCWTFSITTKDEDNFTIWETFEQTHRSSESSDFWDYTDFGIFNFDKKQYQNEIEKLKNF
jgi:hypothetical protein